VFASGKTRAHLIQCAVSNAQCDEDLPASLFAFAALICLMPDDAATQQNGDEEAGGEALPEYGARVKALRVSALALLHQAALQPRRRRAPNEGLLQLFLEVIHRFEPF
jgi:hypothetical protein